MYLVITCLQHVVTLKEKHKDTIRHQQFLCVLQVASRFLLSAYTDVSIHLLCLSIYLVKHEIHPSV